MTNDDEQRFGRRWCGTRSADGREGSVRAPVRFVGMALHVAQKSHTRGARAGVAWGDGLDKSLLIRVVFGLVFLAGYL